MKAIILAAGDGIRMRPLTLKIPKPLLKINGRPILDYIISCLPNEVNELIIVIGYRGEQIKNYCGDEFLGKKINYVWQKEKLGTYHALKLCEPLISKNERFFVLYADDLHGKKGIKDCLNHNYALLVERVEDPKKFGVVRLNEDNSIAEIIEKPDKPLSDLVSTGILLLDSKVFEYEADRHPSGEYYLTSAISKMLKNGYKIFAVKSTMWLPIGYPEDIKKAEEIM
ncbi:MAG: nucleotidyltransferase family protein [Candidatus Azambacteria bacterium]|nr:nucleotidyltransferase family protein [Candidatus Azambacteria bacterium]